MQRAPSRLAVPPLMQESRRENAREVASLSTSRKVIDGSPRTGMKRRASLVLSSGCTMTTPEAKAPIVADGGAVPVASSSGTARHGPGFRIVLVLGSTPPARHAAFSVILPSLTRRSDVSSGMSFLVRIVFRSSARTVPPLYWRSKSELVT